MKLRRLLSSLCAVLLVFTAFSFAEPPFFASGETVDIFSKEDFFAISNNTNKTFSLKNDIYFTEDDFAADNAFVFQSFSGVFDGNGYSLHGITVKNNAEGDVSSYIGGIFASNDGTIKNTVFKDCTVLCSLKSSFDQPTSYVGVIAGKNSGTIENCKVEGGELLASSSCTSKAPYSVVSNSISAGTVCGLNLGTVLRCSSSGSVSAFATSTYADAVNAPVAGGIVGTNNDTTADIGACVLNCSSSANVIADYYAGGIIGSTSYSPVRRCVFSGSVNSAGNAGGIVGTIAYPSEVTGCINRGSVTAATKCGGITAVASTSTVSLCENYGKIVCENSKDVAKLYAGGIVGQAFTSIVENCFNQGEIKVNAPGATSYIYVGGICGALQKISDKANYVRYCYNTGSIAAQSTKINQSGAVAGLNSGSEIDSCYYLEGTYSQAVGKGEAVAYAKSETEMKAASTFVGFDFGSIWALGDGFPLLKINIKPTMGDVNFDGAVDISDAVLSFRFLAGKTELDEAALNMADVNASGKVTLIDVLRLFRFVAGKSTSL